MQPNIVLIIVDQLTDDGLYVRPRDPAPETRPIPWTDERTST